MRCGGSGYMPYPHIQSGICFRCWGTGVDPKDGSDFSISPRARQVRHLQENLTVVRDYGLAHGEAARVALMRLYERQPDRFVVAIEAIKDGTAENMPAALAAWTREIDLHRDPSAGLDLVADEARRKRDPYSSSS